MELRGFLRRAGGSAAVLVLAQSLVGAYLRHSDAGMACGRGVLCNGGLLPPAFDHAIGVNYLHRVLGVLTAAAVVALTISLLRRTAVRRLRHLAWATLGLVLLQVGLGFAGTWTVLAVTPVSLHTLVAASLLAVLVALAARGWLAPARVADTEPVPTGSARTA